MRDFNTPRQNNTEENTFAVTVSIQIIPSQEIQQRITLDIAFFSAKV